MRPLSPALLSDSLTFSSFSSSLLALHRIQILLLTTAKAVAWKSEKSIRPHGVTTMTMIDKRMTLGGLQRSVKWEEPRKRAQWNKSNNHSMSVDDGKSAASESDFPASAKRWRMSRHATLVVWVYNQLSNNSNQAIYLSIARKRGIIHFFFYSPPVTRASCPRLYTSHHPVCIGKLCWSQLPFIPITLTRSAYPPPLSLTHRISMRPAMCHHAKMRWMSFSLPLTDVKAKKIHSRRIHDVMERAKQWENSTLHGETFRGGWKKFMLLFPDAGSSSACTCAKCTCGYFFSWRKERHDDGWVMSVVFLMACRTHHSSVNLSVSFAFFSLRCWPFFPVK